MTITSGMLSADRNPQSRNGSADSEFVSSNRRKAGNPDTQQIAEESRHPTNRRQEQSTCVAKL